MKYVLIVLYMGGNPLTGEFQAFHMQEFGSKKACEFVSNKLNSSGKFDTYCLPYE